MPIAAIAGAAIGVGGSVLSAKSAKKSATKAADASVEAAEIAADVQREALDFVKTTTKPARAVGEQALFKLADLAGVARPVDSQEGVRIDPATGRELDTFTNEPVPAPKTAAPVSVEQVAPPAPVLSAQDARKKSKLEAKLARQPASKTKKRAKIESKLARFLPAAASVPPAAAPVASVANGGLSRLPTIAAGGIPSFTVPGAAPPEDTRTQLTPGTAGGFEGSPGFKFRLQQGVEAIDNAARARGLLRSGRRLKDLTEFGQNIGAAEFTNEFNRLAALAGLGQTANQSAGNAQLSTAANIGNAQLAAGEARSSAFLERGAQNVGLITNLADIARGFID